MPGPSVMVRVLGDITGLGKSFDDTGNKGSSAAEKMHGAFSSVLGQLNSTGVLGPFGETLSKLDEGLSNIKTHAKDIGPAMMGVGATVAGVGLALQSAGSKDAAAHQQLQTAVEATGHSYEEYGGKVEDAIKHQENYGNSAADTQNALQTLTQATGDPAKALGLLSTASDLAAARHENLSTAADGLGKAYNGNTRMLKEFGVPLKDASGKALDQTQIMDALSKKLSGQASAAADTFGGKMTALKTKFEDQFATIGQKYGPALTAAGAVMTGVGATIEVTKGVVQLFKDQTILSTAATQAATAAQWLFNAAMDANVIVVIVIALAALIAIVILAYTHVTVFRNVVDDMGRVAKAAFDTVTNAAKAVWDWVSTNWPLLLAILTGPFGLLALEISKHWQTVLTMVKGFPHDVENIFDGMWDGISKAFKSALNALIDLWNSLKFTLPSVNVGPVHLGGETIGVPSVPHLAQGGIITASGLVYAHAGEAISPIPTGGLGPAVHIDNVNVATELDVDAFMRRAAWAARTARL